MARQRTYALPLYISLLILFVLGFITPTFSPVSAAKDLDLTDDKLGQSSNVEPALRNRLPILRDFIRSVQNGVSGDLVGVYVPGVAAFPVVEQPAGNYGYVSREADAVTLFGLAMNYGTVGLLAHNDLAGEEFNKLLLSMRFILIYGNGKMERFSITDIKYYRALQPNSPYSDFEDLENRGVLLTAVELFNQMYTVEDRVVFQTCVSANGQPSWGRLFVTAEQVNFLSRSPSIYKRGGTTRAH